MKKAFIYVKEKNNARDVAVVKDLVDYGLSLPDVKLGYIYVEGKSNKCIKARVEYVSGMITDAKDKGVDLLIINDISELMPREDCWRLIDMLKESGIAIISKGAKLNEEKYQLSQRQWEEKRLRDKTASVAKNKRGKSNVVSKSIDVRQKNRELVRMA